MLPVAVLLAIRISQGYYDDDRSKLINGFTLSALCSMTGAYYAVFSVIVMLIAVISRAVNGKNIRCRARNLMFPCICFLNMIIQLLPCFLYGIRTGGGLSPVQGRSFADSEIYGLKLVQLILPRREHRFQILAELNRAYSEGYGKRLGSYDNEWLRSFFINENAEVSLGIIAVMGCVISMIWLFKKDDGKVKRILSLINLCVFITATTGGLGALAAFSGFNILRSYCRMARIISFVSLVCFEITFEGLLKKINYRIWQLLCLMIILVGLADQTVDHPGDQMKSAVQISLMAQQELLHRIDDEAEEGDMVFVMPYRDWPGGGDTPLLINPLETKRLIWSCGAVEESREAEWQKAVARTLSVSEMINTLRAAGYDGLWLDAEVYAFEEKNEEGQNMIKEISGYLGQEPEVSFTGTHYYWKLN